MATHITERLLHLGTLLRNRQLSAADLRKLQDNKLCAVVDHAYENVPYYRSKFDSAGLTPDDVRTVEDLPKVPITTKDELRAAGLQRIVARGTDLSSCVPILTSGTTGRPFRIYLSKREGASRRLIHFRAVYSIGFRPRDRLVIHGPTVEAPQRLRFRLGLFRTQVMHAGLSLESQVHRIRESRPTLLWSYPSSLHAVLHMADYRLSNLASPRALITSGEVFRDNLKERVRTDLDVPMFNLYGTMEFGRIAVECTTHEGLHINADQLILECLSNGKPAPLGRPGVVVVTSLANYVMPFIRYQLEDTCALLERRCSCGCAFPLISAPRGRVCDMLQLPSGKLLAPAQPHFILRPLDCIDRFLLIQERRDRFVLQLEVRETPSQDVLSEISSKFAQFFAEPVEFDIQLVDSIGERRTRSGAFLSKLPPVAPWKPYQRG
jgi:phenylacetate-CoA ligase